MKYLTLFNGVASELLTSNSRALHCRYNAKYNLSFTCFKLMTNAPFFHAAYWQAKQRCSCLNNLALSMHILKHQLLRVTKTVNKRRQIYFIIPKADCNITDLLLTLILGNIS